MHLLKSISIYLLKSISIYLLMMRIDHYYKQIVFFTGVIFALINLNLYFDKILYQILIGFFSISIASSANYLINEYLDAKYDYLHPLKKNRPATKKNLSPKIISILYLFLVLFSLYLSLLIDFISSIIIFIFIFFGYLYNVEPFRTKDKKYLDILSESINNPIRLLYGYYIISFNFDIPISLILAYWFSGSYLMTSKRYNEVTQNRNASKYRKILGEYSKNDLIKQLFLYSNFTILFFTIFVYKYNINLIPLTLIVNFILLSYLSEVLNSKKIFDSPLLFITSKKILSLVFIFIIYFSWVIYYEFNYFNFLLLKNVFFT